MSRSRRSAALAVILFGSLLTIAACGGSSSSSDASGAETGAGSGSDASTSATVDDGQVSAERCQELAAQWQGFIAGPATAVGGGPEDAATLRSQIEALDAQIPAPIAGAFATVAASTEKVLDLMGGYDEHEVADGEQTAPADLDARMASVAELAGSPEVTDALARIEAYFAASCPPA